MKIAMLGHKRMPSREGGVEIVVEELSTRMVSLGHDVTVYSRKGHNVAGAEFDSDLVKEDEYSYKGVNVKQVKTVNLKGLSAFSSSYFATKTAIADKPDVIHFHAEGPCAMIGMAKHAGIRTVATIHGLDWQRAKWGNFARWYIKFGERQAVKHADEIVVLSESAREYFMDEYGRETNFIPNGVSKKEAVLANEITKRWGLDKNGYILFLGRIVPEKGIHYLIEAFRQLDTNLRLVIAGGASDSDGYANEVKALAGDDSRIIFTGFVEGLALEELYSNAYCYVLPSDVEGMPISLLEAMAYGNACVTSDIPECTEVTKGYGISFTRGNPRLLRETLQVLVDDSAHASNIGNAASSHVARTYDWNSIVSRTMDLYRTAKEG